MIVDIAAEDPDDIETPVTEEETQRAYESIRRELDALRMLEANPKIRPDLDPDEIAERVELARAMLLRMEEHLKDNGWEVPMPRKPSRRSEPDIRRRKRTVTLSDMLEPDEDEEDDDDDDEGFSIRRRRRRRGNLAPTPSRPSRRRRSSSSDSDTITGVTVHPHIAGLASAAQRHAREEEIRDSHHPPGLKRTATQGLWRFLAAGAYGAVLWFFELVVGRGHIPSDVWKNHELEALPDLDDDDDEYEEY